MEVKGESRQMAQFNKLVGGSSVLQIYTMSAHHLKVVLLGRARENYIQMDSQDYNRCYYWYMAMKCRKAKDLLVFCGHRGCHPKVTLLIVLQP